MSKNVLLVLSLVCTLLPVRALAQLHSRALNAPSPPAVNSTVGTTLPTGAPTGLTAAKRGYGLTDAPQGYLPATGLVAYYDFASIPAGTPATVINSANAGTNDLQNGRTGSVDATSATFTGTVARFAGGQTMVVKNGGIVLSGPRTVLAAIKPANFSGAQVWWGGSASGNTYDGIVGGSYLSSETFTAQASIVGGIASPVVIATVRDTGRFDFWQDFSVTKTAPAGTLAAATFEAVGSATAAGAYPFSGDICGLAVYNAALSDTDTVSAATFLLSRCFPTARGSITFIGDSLTAGTGSTRGSTYPAQTMSGLTTAWNWQTFGMSGTTTVDWLGTPASGGTNPAGVDNMFNLRYTSNIAMVWLGTNDIVTLGATPAVTYANLVAYCTRRKAAGWKVAVLTMLPRGLAYEPARTSYNSLITKNWSQFADVLVDVASDSRIGVAGANTNTRYYDRDQVHLNNSGYAIVAGVVRAELTLQ